MNPIYISGFSAEQKDLADMLWSCKTMEETNSIVALFGAKALVVRDMILATGLDQVMETNLAEYVLRKFKQNNAG